MSDPGLPVARPKRTLLRFTRFNLKFFLVAVTLFCIYTAWHVQRTKAQRTAVEAFEEYGGWVRYGYQFDGDDFDPNAQSWVPTWFLDRLGIDFFHSVVEINCVYTNDYGKREDNSNVGSAPLEQLAALPRLRYLYLTKTQATDDMLAHVGKLKHLVDFFIWDAYEITDAGVAHLDSLRKLTHVHLTESKITDESLRVFGKMRSIETLTLQFNKLSDEGVKHLQHLSNLESLWVCGKESHRDYDRVREERPDFELTPRTVNSITDESLKLVLDSFPKLKRLGIQSTQITREGLDTFRANRPNCKIHEDLGPE